MNRDHHRVTFEIVRLLKACANQKDLRKAFELHRYIRNHKFLEENHYVANTLISMYARCGALRKAQQTLNELPVRDVITWNALIAGYAQQGHGEEALKCFDNMQREGHSPNAVTLIGALKACGIMGAMAKGQKIHDEIVSSGMLGADVVLGGTLVDMYVRCGALVKAKQVLDELPVRDVVIWTSLIAGYTQQGQGEEALKCLDGMQYEGHFPNSVTFTCALKACGSIRAAAKGKELHQKIVDLGMLEKDVVLGNALVDMYVKCAALAKAQQVLHELPVRDVVTWTALIEGYAEQGQGNEALECFDGMQYEGHFPDAVTFVWALKACESIGAVTKGGQIHDKVVSLGMLEKDIVLGNALVDMYAKCGELEKAAKVLEELPVHNVVTWNSLIGGYAQKGEAGNALRCFDRMQSKGVRPDSTSVLCVLNACSHSGLLAQAEVQFLRMRTEYGCAPDLEHHGCMVDIFSRTGNFNKALMFIEKMASADYFPIWIALLSACCQWGDMEIGRLAFEHACRLDKNDTASYVCMINIYTLASMERDTDKIEVVRLANEA